MTTVTVVLRRGVAPAPDGAAAGPTLLLRLSALPAAGSPGPLVLPDAVPSATPAPPVAALPPAADPAPVAALPPVARWVAAVTTAQEPCVVLDAAGLLVGLSLPAADLLGCPRSAAVGRPLLDVVRLVDFETGEPFPEYARRVPPLGVLDAGGLMRGLLRLCQDDGRRLTVDAIAAPVRDAGGAVVGSVTFLALVTPA